MEPETIAGRLVTTDEGDIVGQTEACPGLGNLAEQPGEVPRGECAAGLVGRGRW